MASHYGSVVTWLDDADKARQVSAQLSQAATLRSLVSEDGKEDANVLLLAGTLGGLVQTARLHAVKTEQRESVLWDLWDAWRAGELDAGQVQVGKQLAQALGKCDTWPLTRVVVGGSPPPTVQCDATITRHLREWVSTDTSNVSYLC